MKSTPRTTNGRSMLVKQREATGDFLRGDLEPSVALARSPGMDRHPKEPLGITIEGAGDLPSEPMHGNAPSLSPREIDLVDLESHVGQGGLGGGGQIRCPEDDDPVLVRYIVEGENMGLAVYHHG